MQGETLAQKLFLNENAFQLLTPIATEGFLYTAWKKGASIYLIVLNRDAVPGNFLYDVSPLTQGASKVLVHSMFENRSVKSVNGRIDEKLAPYESKVYEIMLQ